MEPVRIRGVTDEEREVLTAGLRSSKVFTLKRCQILLASARGEGVTQIARAVGFSTQNVRNAIKRFNQEGTTSLEPRSSAPKRRPRMELDHTALERLQALLHENPRSFGIERSTWTLSALALIAHQRRITSRELTDEALRKAIKRLGVCWKRAKNWITSPDPAYARKKNDATD